MTGNKNQPGSWVEMAAIILVFSGAMISILAAIGFYISQAGVGSGSLWPLPGLVLLEWALLGAGGFVAEYLYLYRGARRGLGILWAVCGALLPLIILGAFSIGTLVLVGMLLFLVSAVLLSVRRGTTPLSSLGMFLLGSITNALALLVLVFTANPDLFIHAG